MRHARLLALLLSVSPLPAVAQDASAPAPEPAPEPAVARPAALTAEAMPPIPLALAERVRPYLEARGAGFAGWDPKTRAVLISTRFANVSQLHRVAMPSLSARIAAVTSISRSTRSRTVASPC